MSQTKHFDGKWALSDGAGHFISGQALETTGSGIGPAETLLFYADLTKSGGGLIFGVCQLQSQIAPGQPDQSWVGGGSYDNGYYGFNASYDFDSCLTVIWMEQSMPPTLAYVAPDMPTGRVSDSSVGNYWAFSDLEMPSLANLLVTVVTPGMNATRAAGGCQSGDFSYVDFSGETLAGLNFNHANFAYGNFQGVSLNGAQLNGANFTSATLAGATFAGASLAGASFAGCDLSNLDFSNCNMAGCNFINAILTNTKFMNCPMANSNFVGATFAGTDFSAADISGSNFTGCDLTSIVCASATKVLSTQANPLIFNGAKLEFALIQTKVWTWYDLTNATIHNLPATLSTQASPLNAANAKLSGLNNNNLKNMIWQSAVLDNADLTGLDVDHGDFTNASMNQAVCVNADFSDSTLKNVKAHGTQFGAATHMLSLPLSAVHLLEKGDSAGLADELKSQGLQLSPAATIARKRASFLAASSTPETAAWHIADHVRGAEYIARLSRGGSGEQCLGLFVAAVNTKLSGVYMPNADLTGANLYAVTADHCQWYGAGASVEDAILEEANFSDANLGNMDFKQGQMQGIILTGAILTNCALNGADLRAGLSGRSAALDSANLMGADFTDAKLYGASLNKAAVGMTLPSPETGTGLYLFSLDPALAPQLTKAAHTGSLNPDEDPIEFQAGVVALDRQDLATVRRLFAAQHVTLDANTMAVATQLASAVWLLSEKSSRLYTLWIAMDGFGNNELYAQPPKGQPFSLTPTADPRQLAALKAALQKADIPTLQQAFSQVNHTLPPDAAVEATQEGKVWMVSDDSSSYDVWAGLDDDQAMELYFRSSIPDVRTAFSAGEIELALQTTVTAGNAAGTWIVDSDSNNPINFQLGYITFTVITNGDSLDVYATVMHIEQLVDGNRLEIVPLACTATALDASSLDPSSICPNGATLSSNQGTPGTTWNDWMRCPAPPTPPVCVPGGNNYCSPTQSLAAAVAD